jgi:hypothetical protein
LAKRANCQVNTVESPLICGKSLAIKCNLAFVQGTYIMILLVFSLNPIFKEAVRIDGGSFVAYG